MSEQSILVAWREPDTGVKHVAYVDACDDYKQASLLTVMNTSPGCVVLALVQPVNTSLKAA